MAKVSICCMGYRVSRFWFRILLLWEYISPAAIRDNTRHFQSSSYSPSSTLPSHGPSSSSSSSWGAQSPLPFGNRDSSTSLSPSKRDFSPSRAHSFLEEGGHTTLPRRDHDAQTTFDFDSSHRHKQNRISNEHKRNRETGLSSGSSFVEIPELSENKPSLTLQTLPSISIRTRKSVVSCMDDNDMQDPMAACHEKICQTECRSSGSRCLPTDMCMNIQGSECAHKECHHVRWAAFAWNLDEMARRARKCMGIPLRDNSIETSPSEADPGENDENNEEKTSDTVKNVIGEEANESAEGTATEDGNRGSPASGTLLLAGSTPTTQPRCLYDAGLAACVAGHVRTAEENRKFAQEIRRKESELLIDGQDAILPKTIVFSTEELKETFRKLVNAVQKSERVFESAARLVTQLQRGFMNDLERLQGDTEKTLLNISWAKYIIKNVDAQLENHFELNTRASQNYFMANLKDGIWERRDNHPELRTGNTLTKKGEHIRLTPYGSLYKKEAYRRGEIPLFPKYATQGRDGSTDTAEQDQSMVEKGEQTVAADVISPETTKGEAADKNKGVAQKSSFTSLIPPPRSPGTHMISGGGQPASRIELDSNELPTKNPESGLQSAENAEQMERIQPTEHGLLSMENMSKLGIGGDAESGLPAEKSRDLDDSTVEDSILETTPPSSFEEVSASIAETSRKTSDRASAKTTAQSSMKTSVKTTAPSQVKVFSLENLWKTDGNRMTKQKIRVLQALSRKWVKNSRFPLLFFENLRNRLFGTPQNGRSLVNTVQNVPRLPVVMLPGPFGPCRLGGVYACDIIAHYSGLPCACFAYGESDTRTTPYEEAVGTILGNMEEILRRFYKWLQKDMGSVSFRQGFHLISYSQGSILARAYLQLYNDPPAIQWISIDGPVAGEFVAEPLHCYIYPNWSNELTFCNYLMGPGSYNPQALLDRLNKMPSCLPNECDECRQRPGLSEGTLKAPGDADITGRTGAGISGGAGIVAVGASDGSNTGGPINVGVGSVDDDGNPVDATTLTDCKPCDSLVPKGDGEASLLDPRAFKGYNTDLSTLDTPRFGSLKTCPKDSCATKPCATSQLLNTRRIVLVAGKVDIATGEGDQAVEPGVEKDLHGSENLRGAAHMGPIGIINGNRGDTYSNLALAQTDWYTRNSFGIRQMYDEGRMFFELHEKYEGHVRLQNYEYLIKKYFFGNIGKPPARWNSLRTKAHTVSYPHGRPPSSAVDLQTNLRDATGERESLLEIDSEVDTPQKLPQANSEGANIFSHDLVINQQSVDMTGGSTEQQNAKEQEIDRNDLVQHQGVVGQQLQPGDAANENGLVQQDVEQQQQLHPGGAANDNSIAYGRGDDGTGKDELQEDAYDSIRSNGVQGNLIRTMRGVERPISKEALDVRLQRIPDIEKVLGRDILLSLRQAIDPKDVAMKMVGSGETL